MIGPFPRAVDDDEVLIACDTPGCLTDGYHSLAECFTVEDFDALEHEMEEAGL